MTFQRSAIALGALSALVGTTLAEPSNPHVVSAPIARRSTSQRHAIYQRDTDSVTLKNDYTNVQYTMNISIGTPPQPVTLQIDTGSTDLWVLTPAACLTAKADPETQGGIPNCGGPYDITRSSSSQLVPDLEGKFKASYADGTGAQRGDYVRDTISIGKWTLRDYTFGQATEADTVPGLIGMGFDDLEAGNSLTLDDDGNIARPVLSRPYPAIITSLLDAGYIKTRSFSLWLDDFDESTGTIMFGGFDSAKVEGGQLTMLPMQNDSASDTGIVDRYAVVLSSIGVSIPGSNGAPAKSEVLTPSDFAVGALLDSGASFTQIPSTILQPIVQAMGAQQDAAAPSAYILDCELALTPGSLNFQFGGATGPVVGVPFSELVLPLVDPTTGMVVKNRAGRSLCRLGLSGVDDATIPFEGLTLGDTFLRSAYVYYNLDTLSIGVGQTTYSAQQSNIQEVTSNTTLPSGLSSIGTTLTTPSLTATPAETSSSSPQGEETATEITVQPVSTFNAGAITGQATSYPANLPTAAGKAAERVSSALGAGPTGSGQKDAAPRIGVNSVFGIALSMAVAVAVGGGLLA